VADEKTELAVTDSANIGLGPANAAAQTGMCALCAMYNLINRFFLEMRYTAMNLMLGFWIKIRTQVQGKN
jgi:hypothetical protein